VLVRSLAARNRADDTNFFSSSKNYIWNVILVDHFFIYTPRAILQKLGEGNAG
jgi:hypothetical protein